ncbi:hypothetical protein [Jannaschia sp. M317]|uniref:hypothetical protein n=1 Tax=Jannaschia sp. M317 TaxID=2867011 RepID=UPI0021A5C485|nr:hypothetical protein [Jannaschia sp. M317]UWQ19250.1 hypothetical protein K3551_08275 [Jannaschia sp. M317]
MRGLVLLAALALPLAAQAHDPQDGYAPARVWMDGPDTLRGGQDRIRLVFHGQDRAAALTPNQFYLYQAEYKRCLTQLAMTMPVHRAEARARHHAFHAVQAAYPAVQVQSLDLVPLRGARLLPGG